MNLRALLYLFVAVPVLAQNAGDGLKITTRHASANGGLSWQDTQYFQPDRRRSEHRNTSGIAGPLLVHITRCDLGQNITLNLGDKQYESRPIPKAPSESEGQALAAKYAAAAARPAPTVLVEVTTVDTGERKKLFGYDARHIVTTQKHTRLNDSHEVIRETIVDAWYADLPTNLSCYPQSRGAVSFATVRSKNDPPDIYSIKLVGKLETGTPLSRKTTQREVLVQPDGSSGDTTSTSEEEVTEVYFGPLDPQLFEVPRGFAKVDQISRTPPVPLSVRVQEYWNLLKQQVSRYFR